MGSHSRLINDLSETHDETANRVANVAGQVGRLETDIDKMEGPEPEVQTKTTTCFKICFFRFCRSLERRRPRQVGEREVGPDHSLGEGLQKHR